MSEFEDFITTTEPSDDCTLDYNLTLDQRIVAKIINTFPRESAPHVDEDDLINIIKQACDQYAARIIDIQDNPENEDDLRIEGVPLYHHRDHEREVLHRISKETS